MKAISQSTLGGPDVLETVEIPRPTPRPGQVLLRMCAAAVNPVDCKLRSGRVTHLGDPPFTLGFDVSGIVIEVGDGVEKFEPGDDVFGMIYSRTGTYSEYVLAAANTLAPRPASLDHVQAAALPTAGLTGWQALELADVRAGERILIHAAAGGVGHLAVQFAKERNAYVIGTARAANHDFLRAMGADELVDYTANDFTEAVDKVDVVLDLIGGDYRSRSLSVLQPDGRYIDVQSSNAATDPRYRRVTAQPSPANLSTMGALADQGKLQVEVGHVLPLSEVAEAHRLLESGRVRGKIVMTPWESPPTG